MARLDPDQLLQVRRVLGHYTKQNIGAARLIEGKGYIEKGQPVEWEFIIEYQASGGFQSTITKVDWKLLLKTAATYETNGFKFEPKHPELAAIPLADPYTPIKSEKQKREEAKAEARMLAQIEAERIAIDAERIERAKQEAERKAKKELRRLEMLKHKKDDEDAFSLMAWIES